jgi:hypothetical protein
MLKSVVEISSNFRGVAQHLKSDNNALKLQVWDLYAALVCTPLICKEVTEVGNYGARTVPVGVSLQIARSLLTDCVRVCVHTDSTALVTSDRKYVETKQIPT